MNIHNPIIEPWTEAADRLRNCGHEIQLASDKLVALGNVADSFAPAINEGYLMQANVSDRLHEIAEAYGLYVDYGADAVQSTIADGLDRWQQRQEQQKRKGNGGANGYASPPKGPTNDNSVSANGTLVTMSKSRRLGAGCSVISSVGGL
jgi:hypothetical protein